MEMNANFLSIILYNDHLEEFDYILHLCHITALFRLIYCANNVMLKEKFRFSTSSSEEANVDT